MNLTHTLCEFLVSMDTARIGEANLLDLRYKLLDWTGCVLAARPRPVAAALRADAAAQGAGGCTLVGAKEKAGPYAAAFYNGCVSHALEYDDTNKIAITHPGAPVVAAALAAAETERADVETLLCGIAAGYEAMIRLGAAVNPDHYTYFHTTGTCGAFAAAAAAGRIMGLTGEALERAFGIVSTMASGLINVFGTEAKLVTVGNAARCGLQAAALARAGLTAPEDGFAAPKGYARAARGKEDLSFMLPKPGDALMVEDAYYKMHASCGHTHSALDALQALMTEHGVRAEDVLQADVDVYQVAYELCAAYQTETETRAKFSLPYCIACMLHKGRVTLAEFAPDMLSDPALKTYAERIHIRPDAAFTADYPVLRKERVTLTLADGRIVSRQVDLPVGRPPYAFIEAKYDSLAAMGVSPAEAEAVRQAILTMPLSGDLTPLQKALWALS